MSYLSPTLAVRDVKKTIAFYTKKLGFEIGNIFPDAEKPEYVDLAMDGLVLMFLPASEFGIGPEEKLGLGVNFYLQIDQEIDEYYSELKKRKVKMTADIKDEPFGIRAFTVTDPDGYLLTFNQVIEAEHDHDGNGCGCDQCG